MQGTLFVGRRVELERLRREAEPRGTRPVLVLVGPSGIGKTTLLRRLGAEMIREGYLFLHIELREPLDSASTLAEVIRGQALSLLGPREKLKSAVTDNLNLLLRVLSSYLPGAGEAAGAVAEELISRSLTPLEMIREVFEKLLRQRDARVVLALDEAQHLLHRGGDTWSLLKVLSGLQEDYPGRFRAILATSDYVFHHALFEETHSPTYIDVFYLGEMTWSDAVELAERLAGTGFPEELLEMVGGNPSLIRLVAAEPGGAERRLCHEARKYMQFVLAKLSRIRESREAVRFLADMLEGPQPLARFYSLSSMGDEVRQLLWGLVKSNILQFACRDFVGIYAWNRDCSSGGEEECGGGGLCGATDTVAPASRPALSGLAAALTQHLRPEQRIPDWANGALARCRLA